MRVRKLLAAAALVALAPSGASAQEPATASDAVPPPGWSFTPALTYAGTWDSNPLVRGEGDQLPSDYTNVFTPSGELAFLSRRTQFNAGYNGAWSLYRQLDQLNSFDHRGGASLRHLITPRLALVGRGSFTDVATTELLELVAVPYVRLGSRIADFRGGIEAAVSKTTTLGASYVFQWVAFDEDPVFGQLLLGGRSQGADLTLRHALTPRVALTGGFDLQRAWVQDGTTFDLTHGEGGIEYRISDATMVAGSVGFARLGFGGQPVLLAPRSGLTWHGSLTRAFRRSTFDVSYSRSFVPSYGFGGTSENEELTARWRQPIGRRFYTISAFAWRRNEPVTIGELDLRSRWIEGVIGFAAQPWMRLEGFYSRNDQTTRLAGGEFDHTRIGFQVVTLRPMRIR